MVSLSVRAFDQAQRRKKYPARNGILGVACLQRDLMAASMHLLAASELLWAKEKTLSEAMSAQMFSDASTNAQFNDHVIKAALVILQLSGSIGLDLVTAASHAIERQEMAVV